MAFNPLNFIESLKTVGELAAQCRNTDVPGYTREEFSRLVDEIHEATRQALLDIASESPSEENINRCLEGVKNLMPVCEAYQRFLDANYEQ
jgi:hypothetical protein